MFLVPAGRSTDLLPVFFVIIYTLFVNSYPVRTAQYA